MRVLQTICITAESDNPDLLSSLSVDYASGTSGTLTYAPVAGLSGEANVTVHVQDDGDTEDGGVDAVATTFNVSVLLTGTEGPSTKGIMLYPNPATETLFIEFTAGGYALLNALDIRGSVVYNAELSPGDNKFELDVSDFTPGV